MIPNLLINAGGHNDTNLELDLSDMFPQFVATNLENIAVARGERVKLILTLVMCKNP